MVKVKFCQKYVKSQGQGHDVNNFGSNRKVLPQHKYTWEIWKSYLFWFKSYGQG